MTDDTGEDVSLVRRVPWRRLANVVGLVLILAVVVPFVVYAVPQVVGAEHSYVVLSGSMEPAMSPGDVVVVDDTPAAEIQAGDVITFAEGGDDRPTTHRVIEVVEQNGETAFRTQGDNNPNPDRSLVTPADLEGKVMSVGGYLFVIPLIGHVIEFASTPLGVVTLLLIPLGSLVASEIWDVVATASGGSSASAAAEDEEGGDDEADDTGAVTADATNGDGDEDRIEDRQTVLGPDTDGEAATIEELARTVEERPEAADVPATDGVSGAAAVEGEETEAPRAGDDGDGSEADENEDSGTEDSRTEDSEDEDEDGLVFSAAELQLGLVVLVVFFAYSAWVAYATFFEVWAFAVAASTGAGLLLLGGLYLVGGEAEAEQEAETAEGVEEDKQQERTVDDDDGSVREVGDGESSFAASETDGLAETASEATTTTAETDTGATRGPEVDIDELLSLEASEVDPPHSALDRDGAEGETDADGQRADAAETAEVTDDD
ncbi:MAG: signal peptidase I [Haloarculaceae archaeon]